MVSGELKLFIRAGYHLYTSMSGVTYNFCVSLCLLSHTTCVYFVYIIGDSIKDEQSPIYTKPFEPIAKTNVASLSEGVMWSGDSIE